MIVKEIQTINGKQLEYTYSDLSVYIRQTETGNIYDTAYDIPNSGLHYEETDELISDENEDNLI